jgi:hypothetical protein
VGCSNVPIACVEKLNASGTAIGYEAVLSKQFLFRRIAWRLQANAEGDLSERARLRAAQIADDRDLRIRAPKEFIVGPWL